MSPQGVSVVVPVYNGDRDLEEVLVAILAQVSDGPLECIVVDDQSTDASRITAEQCAAKDGRVSVLEGAGRGAAAAINLGVQAASYPVVCQVDQDVVLQEGWIQRLVEALGSDPRVAAAQGHYLACRQDGLWARVTGLDLAQRYSQLSGRCVDHVCTGNSAYRRAALLEVGGFDESFGYGYDNDMSYRLGDAGYALVFCPDAKSLHRMRLSLIGYLRRQFGYGFGRLDLVARYPRRIRGDQVSGPGMILHAAGMALSLASLLAAGALALAGGPAWIAGAVALVILGVLVTERLVAGVLAAVRFSEPAGLAFPIAHLLRDLAWALAVGLWLARRLGRRRRPDHSMPRLS